MKFNPHDHHQKRQQVFMSSVEWLANLFALLVAFFLTPEIYVRTVDWIVGFTASRYGTGFEDLTSFAWFAVSGLLVFFTARATLATAIVAGGLALATRFV
ncbi:conserved protein of unknown function [Candidatus Filomicrobium marinum]|uniref:Uncharacterized protein n=1 Tax=Candidatus Filomicrobium marinum TaxID=1608628 RepID=A0A0D6JF00_9HYPH|nr:hypothetical protein [Candidatus Filomicrobium marinum]CFX24150.1 conserved protein of unknown function [Candidatus Filomicrobium marinum]CPR19132.1 conserved protein of unknown function [Candidatus Filomicrobium marinum]